MNRWIFCVGVCLLTACGSTSSVSMRALNPQPSTMTVTDARPAWQRLRVTDHANPNTKYYSDKAINPPPAQWLAQHLKLSFGNSLDSRKVTLHSFELSVYDGSLYGGSHFEVQPAEIPAAMMLAPLIAMVAVSSGIDGINADQLITMNIEVEIDGQFIYANASKAHAGHVGNTEMTAVMQEGFNALCKKVSDQLLIQRTSDIH